MADDSAEGVFEVKDILEHRATACPFTAEQAAWICQGVTKMIASFGGHVDKQMQVIKRELADLQPAGLAVRGPSAEISGAHGEHVSEDTGQIQKCDQRELAIGVAEQAVSVKGNTKTRNRRERRKKIKSKITFRREALLALKPCSDVASASLQQHQQQPHHANPAVTLHDLQPRMDHHASSSVEGGSWPTVHPCGEMFVASPATQAGKVGQSGDLDVMQAQIDAVSHRVACIQLHLLKEIEDSGGTDEFLSPGDADDVSVSSDRISGAASSSSEGAGVQPSPPAPQLPNEVMASPLDGTNPGRNDGSKDDARPTFCWNQSPTEITIEINVDRSSRHDVKVVLNPKHISVMRKGEVVLEAAFKERINGDESTWYLEEGKQIVIMLEKAAPSVWENIFADDPIGTAVQQ